MGKSFGLTIPTFTPRRPNAVATSTGQHAIIVKNQRIDSVVFRESRVATIPCDSMVPTYINASPASRSITRGIRVLQCASRHEDKRGLCQRLPDSRDNGDRN